MTLRPDDNITLIGMPGVGKSTVGVLLAKATGRNFVDTDVYLQAGAGRELQEILDADGLEAFCRMEEQYLLCLEVHRYVIATGGSAVYSEAAMRYLRSTGPIVLLDLPLDLLRSRLDNLHSRGVVMPPGQCLEDLYAARRPLYGNWADVAVDCRGLTQDEIVAAILAKLRE